MLNRVNFGGRHLMFTLLGKDEMESHPLVSIIRMIMPEFSETAEVEIIEEVEYTVVHAYREEDSWEMIMVRHDFPHENAELQAMCDERPFQIIIGGELLPSMISGINNYSPEDANDTWARKVAEAIAMGNKLTKIV